MAKVAVFDSGLGSLSVIKEIQKATRCDVVYLADQQNFPYGTKTRSQLRRIIQETIDALQERFAPDLIVVGSNTPTILLDIESKNILGVLPPIREAKRLSDTNIAVLGTRSLVRGRPLDAYLKKQNASDVYKINCSELVSLVESGDFLFKKDKTAQKIRDTLEEPFTQYDIDVATLSSTHLPFLNKYLKRLFPEVQFLDPAVYTAKRVAKKITPIQRNSLKIYSTDTTKTFQKNLAKLGIKNKIISFLPCDSHD